MESHDDFFAFDEEDPDMELEIFFSPVDDDTFFSDATGMFAIMAAANQLLKSKMRSLLFFTTALIFLLVVVLTASTGLNNTWASVLTGSLFAGAIYCIVRGIMYFFNSSQWAKLLSSINHPDSNVRYVAFRALGDTFSHKSGEKLVPALNGKTKIIKSKKEREEESQQRTLDAIGMAIDAYTAAAFQAKIGKDEQSSREVLLKILDILDSLQIPQFSPLFPVDQMEHLEVAICLYLVTLENIKRPQPALYDFEDPQTLTIKTEDKTYSVGALLTRAAKILTRQGETDFALTCYRKSSDWFKTNNDFEGHVDACINAGFVCATQNEIEEAEDMLENSRPFLFYCNSSVARRWWVLDAIIADAYDDEERCHLATANAALLFDDQGGEPF
jgi:ABC-type multidrug transport system fused ATPase/permease subunit